jgi:hypothetical protein
MFADSSSAIMFRKCLVAMFTVSSMIESSGEEIREAGRNGVADSNASTGLVLPASTQAAEKDTWPAAFANSPAATPAASSKTGETVEANKFKVGLALEEAVISESSSGSCGEPIKHVVDAV